jgi:hypothetical protein
MIQKTDQSLGFSMSQMPVIKNAQLTPSDSTFIERQNAFTAEIKQVSKVLGAAFSVYELARSSDGVSSNSMEVYQMKLHAGRNFTANRLQSGLGQVQKHYYK